MRNIYFAFLLFFSLQCYSQGTYAGVLLVEGTAVPVPFELSIPEVEEMKRAAGYAITNFGLEDETKNIVEYRLEEKNLSFTESTVLYTKSMEMPSEMCFISGIGKWKGKEDKSYRGEFVGKYPNGDSCALGSFILVREQAIVEFTDRLKKKVERSKNLEDSTKQMIQKIDVSSILNESPMVAGENIRAFWKGNTGFLLVKEDAQVDGDTVLIQTVDTKRLIAIDEKGKKIAFDLSGNGARSFVISSVSEGAIRPTTASVELFSNEGIVVQSFRLHLNKGEKSTITLYPK